MRRAAITVLAAVLLAASAPARADLLNHAAIRAHVDALFAARAPGTPEPGAGPPAAPAAGAPADLEAERALLADRLTLSLGALVPILGSYRLDRRVFGGIRPAGIVFDWVLGGLVPAGLGLTALLGDGALSPHTRAVLGWTALGCYAATRLGVLVIGNLHISEYNRLVRIRLGLMAVAATAAPGGSAAPAVLATTRW